MKRFFLTSVYYHMKNLEGGMHSELILDFHGLISSLRDYINKFNFHEGLSSSTISLKYYIKNKKGCRNICNFYIDCHL